MPNWALVSNGAPVGISNNSNSNNNNNSTKNDTQNVGQSSNNNNSTSYKSNTKQQNNKTLSYWIVFDLFNVLFSPDLILLECAKMWCRILNRSVVIVCILATVLNLFYQLWQ